MPARSSSKRRRGSKRKERDGTGRALEVYTSEYKLDVDLSLTCNAEAIWYNSGGRCFCKGRESCEGGTQTRQNQRKEKGEQATRDEKSFFSNVPPEFHSSWCLSSSRTGIVVVLSKRCLDLLSIF